MSHNKVSHTIQNSEQYSRSSSKRLFASVFRIIDHDELEVSSFDHSNTNGSRVTSILKSEQFTLAVSQKLRQYKLDNLYPILKITCVNNKKKCIALDPFDLQNVFQRFGDIHLVKEFEDQLEYFVFLNSFSSAFVAMKLMNNFSLRNSLSQLQVNWCLSLDYPKIAYLFPQYHNKVQWLESSSQSQNNTNIQNKQVKLTCRYDIQIQNQKQFQVARRIIGSKGSNMKKIIENALQFFNDQDKNLGNPNEILKLRLRGHGSGYKQGVEQVESQQNLHLCISSKDEAIYNYACQSVQKLLHIVYSEYQDFTRKQGRVQIISIKRSDVCQPNAGHQINNENVMMNSQASNLGRMEGAQIEHLLNMRNKARRQLNFGEADRIRNYLRSCGVCLIDQKGRRGKATEVTTWKYLA